MKTFPGASLFGKLPNALDFVRIHHTYPEALALDRWLAASQQYLQAHGRGWPQESLYFCFVEHGLVGLLAPSKDRAGREYPVAIFAGLPKDSLVAHSAAVPVACTRFLAAAEALLERAPSLPQVELAASLALLKLPAAVDLTDVSTQLDLQLPVRGALDELSTQERFRIYETLQSAGKLIGDAQQPGAIEYPLAMHEQAGTWLRLTQMAGATLAPAFLWIAASATRRGRLLVAAAGLDARILAWWSGRDRAAQSSSRSSENDVLLEMFAKLNREPR